MRSAGDVRPFADFLGQYEQWSTLAWADTKLRYRRTLIGPFWITLSTAVMILSVGVVYGAIFGVDIGVYMPYFAAGIIIWTFISSTIAEGCNVFIQAGGLIKAVSTPLTLHVYRMLARQLILLAHNIVLIAVLWAIFRWPIDWTICLWLPGIAIITITLFGMVLTVGILCTRFRDIEKIVGALLQLLFLLTPIIWMPGNLRGVRAGLLFGLNPLYYLIEVARGPLLGHPPAPLIWLLAGGCALASLAVGIALYTRFKHRVAFWL